MSPMCKMCKGVGVAAITGALILHCPVDLDKHKCPYLPPDKHTHQEVSVPPQYSEMAIVSATSPIVVTHPSTVYFYEDPDRPGNTIYLVNLNASRDTNI